MRDHYRIAAAIALIVLAAAVYSAVRDNPTAQAQSEQPPDITGRGTPGGLPREPTVTVLDNQEVKGILGKEVRSAADENMGRIVDVIVDRTGQAKAAIIDFGGFLGVGSRKIAVAWNALRFPPAASKDRIALELTRDQVRATPEYKEDKPVVVLGASGSLESLPFP